MLDKRLYKRVELTEIFQTERLDSIKGKLDRQGYKYKTDGRGATFTLTITELPPRFRNFCIDELGYAPQTDFKRLKKFLYRFFYDEDFRNLPTAEMRRKLRGELEVTEETISKWIKTLIRNEIIIRDSGNVYYYAHIKDKEAFADNDGFYLFEIDEQTYKEAWHAYWEGREYSYQEAVACMYEVAGGTPHKLERIVENAFYTDKLNTLKEILREEINDNE